MKTIVSITELSQMGYPREAVKRAVNGRHRHRFATRTNAKGKWFINLKAFEDCWNRGLFEEGGADDSV